jgi:hypothetical protein
MMRNAVEIVAGLVCAFLCVVSHASATSVMGRLAMPVGDAHSRRGQFQQDAASSGLFKDATVSLNRGSEYQELVRVDGTFELADVQPGLYTLTVTSNAFQFPLYKVEVKANGAVRALEDTGGSKKVIAHPLLLRPIGQPAYFEPRKQISLYAMFAVSATVFD